MIELTDEEIAARVQRGDIESFAMLVDRYRDKIQRYARRFLFSGEDVDDVVQESFIKAYVNIQSFDTDRKFSPWMYRIAHNEFINTIKKRGREKTSYIDLDTLIPQLAAPETTDSDIHKEELRRELDTSLEKLPSKYREPLVLYYFEDMNYKEIADILHLPVATVGVRLRRGKIALQSLVRGKEEHGTQ